MSSFFQKARDRAQEAATQFQQSVGTHEAGPRGSFTYTGSLPHMLRHGVASVDPRYEYNRSFHQLSGKIKGTRIDHEALARETRGMGTATYRWGQDQIGENRADGAGDEAIADVADRLAYILSVIGDLHSEHAKKVEESRVDLKRIQKEESDLAPHRTARVKIHKELQGLLPERAKGHSEKIAQLEEQLGSLEKQDKPQEEELGKLKREALRSSYDKHFDSLIELGEKMAIVARHGKLLLQQLPVYAPPFPAPRQSNHTADDTVWKGEADVAAIRAAVGPALETYKPDLSLPNVPVGSQASSLSRADTVRYAESHREELASALAEEESIPLEAEALELNDTHSSLHSSSHHLSPLPEGAESLASRINMEPSIIPERKSPNTERGALSPPPALPPRSVADQSTDTFQTASMSECESTLADLGPTFAETGCPIQTNDPGPKTGVLSPKIKSPQSQARPVPIPPSHAKDQEAKAEREANERSEVETVAARVRRDGSIVRRGDADWSAAETEGLPPYQE